MKMQKDVTSHQKISAPRSESVQYATGEEWRAIINISSKNEVAGPKQEQHLAVNLSGAESKVWCYKEQYCIGSWNVRSMNQGKLDMIKQEMARVNWHFRNQWTKMDGNWWI